MSPLKLWALALPMLLSGTGACHQRLAASSSRELVSLANSGSTNTAGYKLIVYKDGSALVVNESGRYGPRSRSREENFPPGSFDVESIKGLLREAGPLDSHKAELPCMKSASFGSSTTLSADGRTSGDLTCQSGSVIRLEDSLLRTLLKLQKAR